MKTIRKTTHCLIAIFCLRLMPLVTQGATSTNALRMMSSAVADAVEHAMPAVVVVRTRSVVYHPAWVTSRGRLYGIPEHLAGGGSGVFIDPRGYVLTSHHVVEKADAIEVVTADGTKYQANIVGNDPATDLAVLKVKSTDTTKFKTIDIGDSEALRVGEFVIAIGSPFSLDSSVSLGIVSQKGRAMGILPYEDFIQTDAPINPGNSGGPLINAEGEMIGINAVIQTSGISQGNIGIGFAVPSKLAMNVALSIVEHGRVRRPWIGISMSSIRPGGKTGVTAPTGVRVEDVVSDSPAAHCGLKVGDIITHADNRPIDDARDLQVAVVQRKTGEKVQLRVNRDGQILDFEMVTTNMPDGMSR
jgi:S1-C subfamily serine protease